MVRQSAPDSGGSKSGPQFAHWNAHNQAALFEMRAPREGRQIVLKDSNYDQR
jgi:hypothetical protein